MEARNSLSFSTIMYCPVNAMQYHYPSASRESSELALASIASITIDDHQVGPLRVEMKGMPSSLEQQNRHSRRLLVYRGRCVF